MSLQVLSDRLWFPPVSDALEDGLLAMGGDLNPERLILAYQKGIFPWFDGDVPLWWSPDPRFVLKPNELKVSSSMKSVLKKGYFSLTTNQAFAQVINECRNKERKGQDGTWIGNEIVDAYTKLHHMGYAHSAETWCKGQLVGGLYGIKMGQLFFGESMFAHQSNASKYAFINYVELLKKEGIVLIDCQVYTPHLESLGAGMIDRQAFLKYLELFL